MIVHDYKLKMNFGKKNSVRDSNCQVESIEFFFIFLFNSIISSNMKSIAIFLACLACAVAVPNYGAAPALVKSAGYGYEHEAPALLKAVPQIPIVRYLKEDDNYGNYNLQTEGGDGTLHSEVGSMITINDPESEGPVNVKTGSYSWTSPEGQVFKVDYVSDETGFHAYGDHLPTQPPLPVEHLKALNTYDQFAARDAYSAPAPVPLRAASPYGYGF